MGDRIGLSAVRLARRSMRHHRGPTVLIVVISALVSTAVIFAAGYQRQVQQAVTDVTFAPDGPNSAWMLLGSVDTDLAAALPTDADRFFLAPVEGRAARVAWQSPRGPAAVKGTLTWRADSCQHLIMTSGRCPQSRNEVAVSGADAERYGLREGQRIVSQSTISAPVAMTITGIYEPVDPDEGYWFGKPPVGASGYDRNDQPQSNPLFTVRELADVPGIQETMDLRLDRPAVAVDELRDLRSASSTLVANALRDNIRVTTAIPASLDRIAAERTRALVGLGLTLAQLAALVAVVIALLASVTLAAQRGELGLGRLRGESAPSLRRQLVGRWAAAVVIGWLIGAIPALVLMAWVAGLLPLDHGLPLGPAVVTAAVLGPVVIIAGIVPVARSTLGQPVIELLRAAPSVSRDSGWRQLVVDVVVVVAALSGLLVAAQSGASSILGLLVPSLLAMAAGVLLARVTIGTAGIARRRWARQPSDGGRLLTVILLSRLRGVRLMTVAICLAAAFVVFAVQVQVIGTDVRRHEAEVRTGAAAVLRVQGEPGAVVRALDALDPGRGAGRPTMTAVVVTRRADASATRGMFVEPAAFGAIAHGVDDAADADVWLKLAAPTLRPIVFTGDAVSVSVGAHPALGRATYEVGANKAASRAELGIVYLTSDGTRQVADLGPVRLDPNRGQQLRGPVDCAAGCRLLQLTVAPDGAMQGPLPVAGLRAETAGIGQPVALGRADDWQPVPTRSPGAEVGVRPGAPGLVLAVSSGGGPVAVQYAWAPTVLPVLAAADVRPEADADVAAPDGSPLPITIVDKARDAIPRQLQGVAVGDLASVLRRGSGTARSQNTVEVWVSASAAERLPVITTGMADRGLPVIGAETVESMLDTQRLTAAALTGAITPALAALGMILASVAMALTVAGQRPVLTRDLAALRLVGLGGRTVRRAMLRVYLVPGLAAVLSGALCGAVGCVLVIGGLPLLPDASPAIRLDLGLRPLVWAGCLLAGSFMITVVGLVSVTRLLAGSGVDQLRSPR